MNSKICEKDICWRCSNPFQRRIDYGTKIIIIAKIHNDFPIKMEIDMPICNDCLNSLNKWIKKGE